MDDKTKRAYRAAAGYTLRAIEAAMLAATTGEPADKETAEFVVKRVSELAEIAELIEKDLENAGY